MAVLEETSVVVRVMEELPWGEKTSGFWMFIVVF